MAQLKPPSRCTKTSLRTKVGFTATLAVVRALEGTLSRSLVGELKVAVHIGWLLTHGTKIGEIKDSSRSSEAVINAELRRKFLQGFLKSKTALLRVNDHPKPNMQEKLKKYLVNFSILPTYKCLGKLNLTLIFVINKMRTMKDSQCGRIVQQMKPST